MTKAELIALIVEQEEITASKAESILNCIGNIATDQLKADLIALIVEQEEITASKAESILNCIGNIATDQLKAGDEMVLPGIGKLKPKTSAARTGRNPKTGESIEIAEKTVVKFTVAKALKDAVA